jgi:hypothetical protein
MFGWLGKKKSPSIKDNESYKKGQQFGGEISEALNEFIETRFAPVRVNYLNVFRGQLQKILQSSEAPPLTVGRIEFKLFSENVKELETKMLEEINSAMVKWMEVADMLGARSDVDALFKKRVSDYGADLTIQGFKVLTDYAVPLKDADIAWRNAYPREAAKYPEEEPLPETYYFGLANTRKTPQQKPGARWPLQGEPAAGLGFTRGLSP